MFNSLKLQEYARIDWFVNTQIIPCQDEQTGRPFCRLSLPEQNANAMEAT